MSIGVVSEEVIGGGMELASVSVIAEFEVRSVPVIAACDCDFDWEEEGRAV